MRRWGSASILLLVFAGALALPATGRPADAAKAARIVLLHHSTGQCIWDGGVQAWVEAWNRAKGTRHRIREQIFPKSEPYGWENYPYDYYNIWVKHAGAKPFREEPTLEMLTKAYDVIVFKHCFPVSNLEPDTGRPDVASPAKQIENYKLQYEALKAKMRAFPQTRFLVWTGAALVRGETDPEAAKRARAFADWVKTTWDEKGDNVFVWDFRALETEGGLYLKEAYAQGDSHPNEAFSKKVAPYLGQRIVDIAEGRGDTADVTGRHAARFANGPVDEEPAPEPEPEPEPVSPTDPAPPLPTDVERWVFDDAESAEAVTKRWGAQAARVKEGDGHALRLDFTKGVSEDWGEYGPHRVVETRLTGPDRDVSKHRYLALRVRSDRKVLVPLALVTRARGEPTHFAFTAYLALESGPWRWMVFDLAKLELAVEGPPFYEKAGSPSRLEDLSTIRLSIHADHEKAKILLDDVTFLKDLPESLEPFLQRP